MAVQDIRKTRGLQTGACLTCLVLREDEQDAFKNYLDMRETFGVDDAYSEEAVKKWLKLFVDKRWHEESHA